MSQNAEYDSPAARDRDSGSIGIGAMIVFIALILVAAVASTIIIKTAEELQQNAESTSQDTRDQISGKVSISDVYVKQTHESLGGATGTHDNVDIFDVIARVSSGSLNVQEGDISYYVTCTVEYSAGGTTFAVVDYGVVDARNLSEATAGGEGHASDATFNTGDEITAGTTFHFQIDLKTSDPADDDTIDADDFGESDPSTAPPGCDTFAGVGEELGLRIVVEGGGETLATLKIDSISLGKSVM